MLQVAILVCCKLIDVSDCSDRLHVIGGPYALQAMQLVDIPENEACGCVMLSMYHTNDSNMFRSSML